jgi:hypothetical protein
MNKMVCPKCQGTEWEQVDHRLRCVYCGFVQPVAAQVEAELSDAGRLDYLKIKANAEAKHKRTKMIIFGVLAFVIISLIAAPFLPDAVNPVDLQTKVEAVSVVGESAKAATKKIKAVDVDAHVTYVIHGIFGNKDTDDLSLKVEKMTVDYAGTDHSVELQLKK